jgi:diazepam-binding inhibitor (GABA receptor modulator, acyl-CoA-binding protein)
MTDAQSLRAAFEQARAATADLTERPDNATLLKLYALYKQGSLGDNDQPRPGFSDIVARAKWDAWQGLKGLAREDAMTQYIDLVEQLS